MTDTAIAPLLEASPPPCTVTTEQPYVRIALTALAVVFLVLFLFLPLAAVFF